MEVWLVGTLDPVCSSRWNKVVFDKTDLFNVLIHFMWF